MNSLQTGPILKINRLKIIPIEETTIYNKNIMGSTFLYASKKPFALVIQKNDEISVLDFNSGELSLDSLINEVSGLGELLKN